MRGYFAGNVNKSSFFLRKLRNFPGFSFHLYTPTAKLCLYSIVAVLRVSNDRKNCARNDSNKAEYEALHRLIAQLDAFARDQ